MRKKAAPKIKKYIEVQIMTDMSDLSEIGVVFRSNDGSQLTAQELLDAFSDALIVEGDVPFDMTPEESYDS